MPTNIYDPCINAISGETFRTLSHSADAFVMQWTVQAAGYVPFEHIHLHQDEVFHVEKGELRIKMRGKHIVAKAGKVSLYPEASVISHSIIKMKCSTAGLSTDRALITISLCIHRSHQRSPARQKRRDQYSPYGIFSAQDEGKMYDKAHRDTGPGIQHRFAGILLQGFF